MKNRLAAGGRSSSIARWLGFEWRIKQAGQLNSKMRLVAAWLGLLEGDVWPGTRHANAMAQRL